MSASPVTTVRYPEAGEVLRVNPSDPCAAWYRVHRSGSGVFPCVPGICPGCATGHAGRAGTWEGYLACVEEMPRARPLVLRLPPGVWLSTLRQRGHQDDLRQYKLSVFRVRCAGKPQVDVTFLPERREVATPHHYQTNTTEFLRRWWHLPPGMPDYRKAVWALEPLAAPRVRAPSFARMREQLGLPECQG